MLHSLKFRLLSVLLLLGFSIATLSYIQLSYSQKTHELFDAQLLFKDVYIQFVKMENEKIKYFDKGQESSAESVIVYSETLDLFLELADEELEEFNYSEVFQDDILGYQEIFLKLTHTKYKNSIALKEQLNVYSKKVQYIIESEQLSLIPQITQQLEDVALIQKSIYVLMFVLSVFLLLSMFKPLVNSILLFKNFFSHYSSTQDRLNLDKLYFKEIKEIASHVNGMLENQENAQKVKDEFLGNMSHELRTPLNAISGFAGVLLRKLPEEKETIEPIVDSAKHLLQLVSDILDLSKIQSGKFEIIEEPFGLYSEILHFKELFKALVENKNINFTLEYNADNNLRLMGDWFRISQILNNFMSNAIKFTPQNGAITLNAEYKDGLLYMGISDSGIGIPKESLKTILKPFEQSDKSVTKKFGGTGLGLSIAKTLTDMMDGTFDIKSEVDKGSTFSIKLPLEELESEKNENRQKIEVEEEEESEVNFNIHVLVAEDNKTNQMLLDMLLDDLGVTCDIANDGQEALDMYEPEKYAMVLMDENMPNLSGTDSMLSIREKFEKVVPIIAVTANAMKGDREKLLKLGMDDFLSKPIDNDLLIDVIQRNLA